MSIKHHVLTTSSGSAPHSAVLCAKHVVGYIWQILSTNYIYDASVGLIVKMDAAIARGTIT